MCVTWEISASGKQIVINHGYCPEDYIDLLHIGNDKLIIGKKEMFQSGKRKGDYVDYYYKLEMQKRKLD